MKHKIEINPNFFSAFQSVLALYVPGHTCRPVLKLRTSCMGSCRHTIYHLLGSKTTSLMEGATHLDFPTPALLACLRGTHPRHVDTWVGSKGAIVVLIEKWSDGHL